VRCAKLRCVLWLAIACAVSAAAWVYLVAAHGGFWQTGQRLPGTRKTAVEPQAGEPAVWPALAAVVPARNEAESLPSTLPALLGQDYPGEFRVFLVDDRSDDGTGQLAAELGEKAARDGGAPLTVVGGAPRPDGWAGKVWAMAQGFAAATGESSQPTESSQPSEPSQPSQPGEPSQPGAPEYLLFTDADIHWSPTALRDLVRAAASDDRAMVSQMALLRAETAWERLIVPAFVYFFAQLYPFRRVNDPRRRTAAAAGGCMLVRTSALEAAGGLEPIRGALIDDVALGTLLKRTDSGQRIWLGLTTDVVSARPYPSLRTLWHMIARSAYVQLRYNRALLAGTLVGLLLLYVVPPVGAISALTAAGSGGAVTAVAGLAGLAGWVLMTVSFIPMLRLYRLSPLRAPALPLIALLYAAMTADSARRHYSGRAVSWRGRVASL
jgi:hopene-associated glycosyltransferase HpnB